MSNRAIALFTVSIPYIKELKELTGSVKGSIVMRQMEFWFDKYPKGFYKFIAPSPKNKFYIEEDSWQEELAFSRREFDSAFKIIGIKYKSLEALRKEKDPFKGKFYCSATERPTGKTYYYRNDHLLDKKIKEIANRERVHKKTDRCAPPLQNVNYPFDKMSTTHLTKCAFDITENTTENNTDNFKTKVFSISELDELEQLKIDNKNLELKIKELEKATESDNVNIEVKKELPVKDSSAKKTDAPKKRKRKAQPKYPSSKALDIFNKYWMPLTGDEDGFYLNQKEARQLKNLFVFVNRKQKDATDEVKLESFDKFLALTLALENKFFTDSFTPSLLMCHSSTINTNIGSALTNKDNRQHHKIKSIWEGKSYEPVTTEYTKYLDECKEFFPSASQFKNVLSEEDFKLVKDRKVFEERVYGMYTRWDRMMLYIHWALDAGKINLSGHNGSMIEYMRRTIREYLNHKINDPSASNDEFDKFRINYITDNRVWYKK